MLNLAKVWPLVPGLDGCTTDGHEVSLQPGVAGFMEYTKAVRAEKRGEVQLMAGQTPQSLRTPTYDTRDLAPESTPSPSSPLRVPKESMPPLVPRRKKRTYSRRDIQAEKPSET